LSASTVRLQKNKFSIKSDGISVIEVFTVIESETSFKLFYKNTDIELNKKIAIDVTNIGVNDLMNETLGNTNLNFKIRDKQIIIYKTKNNQQQLIKISGVVIDENNTPMPGVAITVMGSKKGVISDFDGNFYIEVPLGKTLTFNYLGYKTIEVVVKKGTPKKLNITLEASKELLDEVVVTGFETSEKRKFTGATSSITAEEIKIDGVVDAGQLLEGRIAGVTLQNVTGTFGAAPKVTIRGASSVFGDTKPLWVIDGVIQEEIVTSDLDDLTSGDSSTLLTSPIAGLNPNDIEKIDVLKDASATSLYGARALNGVIVITTKSGKANQKMKVNYSLEQTIRDIPNYNQYDIVDSRSHIGILQELQSKGYFQYPASLTSRFGGIFAPLAQEINKYDESKGTFGVENTPAGRNQYLQQFELANTNWFDVLFKRSLTQNHSLSISGGGKNNAFYSSLGFYNDPGWTVADETKRFTANLKNTFYLNDKFTFTLSSKSSIRNQKAPGTLDVEKDEFRGTSNRGFDINPFNYALNTSRALIPSTKNGDPFYYQSNYAPFNILNELENNYLDLNVQDVLFQADASYKFNKNFQYNFLASGRFVSSETEHNITEDSNIANSYRTTEPTIIRDANPFLFSDPLDPTKEPVTALPLGGLFIKTNNSLTTYYIRNSLNFTKSFNKIHEVDALLGQEIRIIDRDKDRFTGYGIQYSRGFTPFTDPNIFDYTLGQGNNYFSIEQEKERTVAFFGKGTYTFDKKYTVSVTGRYDGSNRQGKTLSSRWLPTYSISGKWNVHKERFMNNIDVISGLSLRASYGLSATAGPATNSLAIIKNEITRRQLINDRENILNITELQNDDLTWEKQFETNIGLDLGLLNNRFRLTTDIFRRNGFDLIDNVRSSGVGGQFIKEGNNADLLTEGIEFAISGTLIKSKDFKWKSSLNFSVIKQEVTALNSKPTVFDLIDPTGGNVVGRPRQSLYSFDFKGLDDRGLPRFNFPENTSNLNNEITGADFQAVDNITDYLIYHGPVEPTKSGGFTNTFTYKNVSLSVFISASAGNKIRLDDFYPINIGNSGNFEFTDIGVFRKDAINRWIIPGDEKTTKIPSLLGVREVNNITNEFRSIIAYNNSTERVADGDFVRLKNISFTYGFPKDLVKKLGLGGMNLRFSGTNLLLLYSDDKLNGQDPEFFRSGGVSLPITRQYSLSLNINF